MSIFHSLIPAALSLLIAGPAFALSCLPYSARQAFQDASESADLYVLVHGQLVFNRADLPVADMSQQGLIQPDNFLRARLSGDSLTEDGFTARFASRIDVNVQCFGPWCGGLSSGSDYLIFLKQTASGYLLETNPCGGFAFEAPQPATLDDMHQCLLGNECAP